MGIVQIAWGLEIGTNISRHVSEVDRGKSCNCICLSCEKQLIAAKGENNADHFRHFNGGSCSWESVLHKLAKEIIVSEANKGNFILLPKSEEISIDVNDLFDNTHKNFYAGANKKRRMIGAIAEKKMDNSTVSDVLVYCENDKQLAVEIYVTHKKDDKKAEDYSNLKLSSIEIDLSGISWQTKRDELRKKILSDAPRKWLNNQERKLKFNELSDELNRKVYEKNDYYKKQLFEYVKMFDKMRPFANASIIWPQLSAKKFKRHKEFRPKVTEFTGDWQRISFGEAFVCEALTQSQDQVKVCVCLPSYKEKNFEFSDKHVPVLYCNIKIGNGESLAIEPNVYWQNIECWMKMLASEGENNENKIESLFRYNNKKQNIDDIELELFCKKDELQKYKYLLEMLDYGACNSELGCFSEQWNLSEKVWVLVVRYFFIINSRKALLRPSLLAMSDKLVKLTGAPTEYRFYKLRVHDIHQYLMSLAKYGLVSQISDTEFLVN